MKNHPLSTIKRRLSAWKKRLTRQVRAAARHWRRAVVLLTIAALLVLYLIPFHSGPLGQLTEARCTTGGLIQHTYQKGVVVPPDVGNATNSAPAAVKQTTATTTSANVISNPGVEASQGGQPTNWLNFIDNQAKADFTYIAQGHSGSHALRIDLTQAQKGSGADWYFLLTPVQSGGYYAFSDYYKSNVTTSVVLETEDAAGNQSYTSLPNAAVAPNWTLYRDTFFIPSGAVTATVYQVISTPGSLITDDYQLAKAPLGQFDSGIVSLTFDDGWRSVYQNAFPILKRDDLPSTLYLISGYLNAPAYLTVSEVYQMRDAGEEIGSHTVNHLDLTLQTPAVAQHELSVSKRGLDGCFGNVTDFAPPYGTLSAQTTSIVKDYYTSQRTTYSGYNTADNFNAYQIKVQNVGRETTEAQVKDWLNTAKTQRVWLVLVYHQVDQSGSDYARTPADFASDAEAIQASGLKVLTMHDALQSVKAQIKHK